MLVLIVCAKIKEDIVKELEIEVLLYTFPVGRIYVLCYLIDCMLCIIMHNSSEIRTSWMCQVM